MNKDGLSFEEYLDRYGSLTYTNVGVSMMPLLRQGKDLFTVRKKGPERCRRGDVVLYTRPPDQYVLHRVIEVRPDDYVILGDNCVSKEYGIREEQILGVMTGYVRGGKAHSVTEKRYRLYSAYVLRCMPVRIFYRKLKGKLIRGIKKLIK
jgi:hypothetical protein